MPQRISVWPAAIHTRTPDGTGIIAVVAVHYVANLDLHTAIPKGLAAAVDFARVERGDGIVESLFTSLLPPM